MEKLLNNLLTKNKVLVSIDQITEFMQYMEGNSLLTYQDVFLTKFKKYFEVKINK